MAATKDKTGISVIKLLELHTFFPKKITRQKALTVSKNRILHKDLQHPRQLPWFLLENLIVGNYEGRSFELCRPANVTTCDASLTSFLEDSDTCWAPETEINIHPLDVLTALFMCCDDFLRQLLVEKLSMCQLSIPLLLPVIDDVSKTSEMLLWATSTLSKQWKTSSESSYERSMAVHPFPIVSALRIGRPHLSKSDILNNIFDSQQHKHFFHSKCKGGSAQKILSNGMLEIMWHLPMGNDRDNFSDAFGIMNLRGNAYTLNEQIQFITKTSSTTIVFCRCDKLDKDEMNFITSWNNQNSNLILVFDGNPVQEWKPVFRSVQLAFNEEKSVHLIINDNKIDIVSKLTQVIKQCMANTFPEQTTPKSLENCEEIASNAGIRTDVKITEENTQMKMEAIELLSCLDRCQDKEALLPLQLIASDIATKERELLNMKMKGEQQTEMYAENIKSEMRNLRKEQMMAWENRSDLIKRFVTSFKFSQLTRTYCNQWTSIILNRYSSHHLQRVRQEYKAAWESQYARNTSGITGKLTIFQDKLFNYSLGIENVYREVAQVYEMASDIKNSGLRVNDFPDVAAEMLLNGHPLELMDGDATYVPVTWLSAVLTSLNDKVCNAKIFVLSVLGVQGSGKSTMLNAMFGLKFAVSAGRCTRGAFAQLVPLDRTLQQTSKCEYILVIDTEGLRAPEFAGIEQNNRDNEMATFIIGLGDATLINIMGGNQAAMQDILQIVVYALLKMKYVNLKPSCIFVHQLISDMSASEKSTAERIKLRELLDKTTKISAEQVQRTNNKCILFSDVINFQEDKHVAYISNLWKGDPPMAPPNPGYSQSILELRKLVFNLMDEFHGQTITDFKYKLVCLWEAVLCEDFVFSFKNMLEIQTHSALETKYIQLSRDFRQTCITNCNAFINVCSKIPAEKMDSDGQKTRDVYLSKLKSSYKFMFTNMIEYFEKNTRAQPWREQIKAKMCRLDIELRNTLKDEFQTVKQSVIWKAKIDKAMMKYELDIRTKSRQLADKFKDSMTSELHLRSQFNDSWKYWIEDIPVLTDRINIKITLERLLFDRFVRQQQVIQKLLGNPRSIHGMKVTDDDISRSNKQRKSNFRGKQAELKKASCLIQEFRNKASSVIRNHKQQGGDLNEQILTETVDVVCKQLTHLPNTVSFVFTYEGIAKNTLCILWRLLPEFEALRSAFREKNDPRAYMNAKKEILWHTFKNECAKAESAVTASCIFSFSLTTAIMEAIKRHYVADAIKYFRTSSDHKQTFSNKRSFHAKMLIDLAETNSFDLFAGYLVNPPFRMSCWLQEYIINALQKESDIKGRTVLKNIYCNSVRVIYTEARTALQIACSKQIGTTCRIESMWQEIINNFRLILVTTNMSHNSNENCKIHGDDFLIKLTTEFNGAELEMSEKFNEKSEKILKDIVHWVIEFFEKDLIGCQEMCPFCKALCDNFEGCQSHRTECHRPQGVGGYHWVETNTLVVDLCTTAVCRSDRSFRHSGVDLKWHSFNEYHSTNKRFRSWNIEPMLKTDSQLYWKWFMTKYNKQLAEFYGCEEADVPDNWENIDWESAKMDMIALYNL